MKRREFLTSSAAGLAAPEASRSVSLERRILSELDSIPAIDTHEHIIPEHERVSQPVDFFTLASHYAIDDLTSAGLPPESLALINSAEAGPDAKWAAFEPYWKYARFTGYGQALALAIQRVYGFSEISAATLPKIDEAIAARNKAGLYKYVLKDLAHIRIAINDDYWNAAPIPQDPRFFAYAHKFDRFATPITPEGVHRLEKLTNVSITNIASLKRAMEKSFDQALAAGMITVKSTIAYDRDLTFQEVSEGDAGGDFQKLISGEVVADPPGWRRSVHRPFRKMEDHMYHHLVQLAEAHHLPMQIHTGLQAGNGNFIANSNPTQLTSIFFRYPKVQFDVFHIGYPYDRELTAIAKMFPNVNADFCWVHIVSPSAARQSLDLFMDTVPLNKIMGFGGDYRYPELSFAHLIIARRNTAQVLAGRVQAGLFTETEAVTAGRMLLHDNPARLFFPSGLPNRDATRLTGNASK